MTRTQHGPPGTVGKPSQCVSCYGEIVGPGETECAFCRAVDGDSFGWKRDVDEWNRERGRV